MKSSRPAQASRRSRPSAALPRYDVRQELARGGMGVVYQVHDRLLDRPIALKRLLVAQQASLRARITALFQNEYDTLAQLAHPCIVDVYEYGVDAEGPYYTMELLSGGDLSKAAPLPFPSAARLLRDVASALALVHARRLIHRDLSPANVRLTADGRAKLLDFGALTSFGVPPEIVGTTAFVAPECLRGAALDQRVDLYALGVLAYWCVTGRQALHATNLDELLEAFDRPLVPPSVWTPDLPRGMEELILSLLSHDPLARPGSAAEVMDRLSALASLPPEEQQTRVAESYLAHPPLIGRDSQLKLFGEQLSEAFAGRGAALWIEAAHGLGRSALLDACARKSQLAGAALLRARAHGQSSPFHVLRSLLRAALAIEPRFAEAEPELGRFCAGDAPEPQVRSAALAVERNAKLLASSERCILDFAARTPLVLLLDDAQSADSESLGLLVALAQRAKEHALLLVLSATQGDTLADAHAHARLVADSAALSLTPLNLELLIELTTAIFGPVPNVRRLAQWLQQNGGENPQRCLMLARLLLTRGEIQYLSGTFSLPYDVRVDLQERELEEATFARIEQLSAAAQHVARLLSALEMPVSLGELASLEFGGLGQRELLIALAELTAPGIVKCVEERYSFASPASRDALVRATPAATMHGVHARIGRSLLADSRASLDTRARAAYHLLRGGEEDDGLRLIVTLTPQLSRDHESLAKAVPAIELALRISAERGHGDRESATLLFMLSLAGFYRDPRLFARYFRRAWSAHIELCGAPLAARLERLIGEKPAFLAAVIVARVRYVGLRDPGRRPFKDVFLGLFALAGAGSSAAAAAFEFELLREIGESLAPFRVLGARHIANVVRQFCLGVAESRRGPQHAAEERLSALAELLSDARKTPRVDHDVRVQILIGVLYALGMIQLLRASNNGLSVAQAMDAEQRGFFAPHAELLRMLHHALRGDQQAAEPHRERTERLALFGGAGWAPVNNAAHRAILVYEWTEDSMALLRVITDLKRFAVINPAVLPHIELAEAHLELLRGRPQQAVERYARAFQWRDARHSWTWLGDRGRYAEALNALGQHEQARSVCRDALHAAAQGELRYHFLSRVPLQQWALADAYLGEHAAARERLDALLAEAEPSHNPLLRGSLHRACAQVALLAGDHAGFEEHLRAMIALFRATKNPALIRQCERLYALGIKQGFVPGSSGDGAAFPLGSVIAGAFHVGPQAAENSVLAETEILLDSQTVPKARST